MYENGLRAPTEVCIFLRNQMFAHRSKMYELQHSSNARSLFYLMCHRCFERYCIWTGPVAKEYRFRLLYSRRCALEDDSEKIVWANQIRGCVANLDRWWNTMTHRSFRSDVVWTPHCTNSFIDDQDVLNPSPQRDLPVAWYLPLAHDGTSTIRSCTSFFFESAMQWFLFGRSSTFATVHHVGNAVSHLIPVCGEVPPSVITPSTVQGSRFSAWPVVSKEFNTQVLWCTLGTPFLKISPSWELPAHTVPPPTSEEPWLVIRIGLVTSYRR